MLYNKIYRKLARILFQARYHSKVFSNNPYLPLIEFDIMNDNNVYIDKTVSFRRGCVLRVRENGKIRIGKNTSFNNNCVVTCRNKIIIGEHVLIGPNVAIFDHDHDFRGDDFEHKFVIGDIVIGNRVWIGANVTILKGTQIADGAVIGANSIVSGIVPENSVYANKIEKIIQSYK